MIDDSIIDSLVRESFPITKINHYTEDGVNVKSTYCVYLTMDDDDYAPEKFYYNAPGMCFN